VPVITTPKPTLNGVVFKFIGIMVLDVEAPVTVTVC